MDHPVVLCPALCPLEARGTLLPLATPPPLLVAELVLILPANSAPLLSFSAVPSSNLQLSKNEDSEKTRHGEMSLRHSSVALPYICLYRQQRMK